MILNSPHHKFILWLVLFMFGPFVWAKTYTICQACEHSSVKETIQLADAHDTLLVQKGTYREFEILVDRPLVIKGIGYPIVDGEKKRGNL